MRMQRVSTKFGVSQLDELKTISVPIILLCFDKAVCQTSHVLKLRLQKLESLTLPLPQDGRHLVF